MMRRLLETAVVVIGTLGWWGFVYPELCLLETSYEETTQKEEDEGWRNEQKVSTSATDKENEAMDVVVTLPANGWGTEKEVHIKSKIAEYVYQIRSRETKKDNKDDS